MNGSAKRDGRFAVREREGRRRVTLQNYLVFWVELPIGEGEQALVMSAMSLVRRVSFGVKPVNLTVPGCHFQFDFVAAIAVIL